MRKKFKQIVSFIKKYRELGIPEFTILTNSDTIILTVEGKDRDDKMHRNQIRIKYK